MLERKNINQGAYFDRFNQQDLMARQCSSKSNCIEKYIQSLRKPNKAEADILMQAQRIADGLLVGFTPIHKLPWNILVTNDQIESGFPHTHHDVIVIPSSHILVAATKTEKLVDTLIHEKVHVYQRLHPCECNILYTRYWNLAISHHNPKTPSGYRTNPDTNMLAYTMHGSSSDDDRSERLIFASRYIDKETPSLDNAASDYDHPHEMMAYLLAWIITNGGSHLDIKLKRFVPSTKKWIENYITGQSSSTQGS